LQLFICACLNKHTDNRFELYFDDTFIYVTVILYLSFCFINLSCCVDLSIDKNKGEAKVSQSNTK